MVTALASPLPVAAPAAAALLRRAPAFVAGGLLAILLISFEPFKLVTAIAPETKSSSTNLLGFAGLGMVALTALATMADARRLIAAIDPAGLALGALVMVSALQTPDPLGTMRSVGFALTTALIAAAVVLLPRDQEEFTRAAMIGVIAALGLAYFGVIVLPQYAIHTAASVEYQHAGLWRGHYSHKNIAGPVMTVLFFFGVYFMRMGRRGLGAVVCVLALVFVLKSGSKTTLGLAPLTFLAVYSARLFGSRLLAVLVSAILFSFFAMLTIGSVVSDTLADLTAALLDDPTFTGRTTLWRTGIAYAAEVPWTGYGFDNFWMKPIIADSILPIDAEWDFRMIVNGHDNYIDMALFVGLPGLVAAVMLFVVRPMRDYLTCPPLPGNREMADLFMMIALFSAIDSLMESFWFRRSDPVWILTFIGVFGLRMVNRTAYR